MYKLPQNLRVRQMDIGLNYTIVQKYSYDNWQMEISLCDVIEINILTIKCLYCTHLHNDKTKEMYESQSRWLKNKHPHNKILFYVYNYLKIFIRQ